MIFYIGIFKPSQITLIGHKYFMYSFRSLWKRKKPLSFPSRYCFFLDSGGFMFIKKNGKYPFNVDFYLKKVEMLQPNKFVIMDYMCEPSNRKILKMSVKQSIDKTIENTIKTFDKIDNYDIDKKKIVSVIQGWEVDDYLYCIDQLREHSLLTDLVGVGSICRRNKNAKILSILRSIHKEIPTIKLHGFGVKLSLLNYRNTYQVLHSCDSMAWCISGYFNTSLYKHLCNKKCIYPNRKNCTNCEVNAKYFLSRVLNRINKNKSQAILSDYL